MRSTSSTPSSSSSAPICCDTADCERWSLSAVRRKWSDSASTRNVRSRSRFMFRIAYHTLQAMRRSCRGRRTSRRRPIRPRAALGCGMRTFWICAIAIGCGSSNSSPPPNEKVVSPPAGSAKAGPPPAPPPAAPPKLDTAGMDRAVSPGDDFFAYANGGWMKTTDIPADRSNYGTGAMLVELTAKRVRELIEDAAAHAAPNTEARKIGDYYASFMDEAAIEAKGMTPLEPALAKIAKIADAKELSRALGETLRADVDALNN